MQRGPRTIYPVDRALLLFGVALYGHVVVGDPIFPHFLDAVDSLREWGAVWVYFRNSGGVRSLALRLYT